MDAEVREVEDGDCFYLNEIYTKFLNSPKLKNPYIKHFGRTVFAPTSI